MAETPAKVLYFAGAGRSGGTILCHILGQQPGWFYAGELRDLWTSGLRTAKMCGCGKRVIDCDLWRAVFEHAYGGVDAVDTAEMTALREGLSRTRRLLSALLMGAGRPHTARRKIHLERLAALYSAIRAVTGCRVIVDASRLVPNGLYFSALLGVDSRIADLVRDPRAVVSPWTRRRKTRTATQEHTLRTQGALQVALDWVVQNWGGELIWRHAARPTVLVRFEDAVADPGKAVGRVAALMEESPLAVRFSRPGTVDLKATHSVADNAYRAQTGPMTLSLDDAWRTALGWGARLATTILCWPGMLRYRYPLRASS